MAVTRGVGAVVCLGVLALLGVSCNPSPPPDKDLEERLLADLTLMPTKLSLLRMFGKDLASAIDAVARRLDLTVAQRTARVWMLCPVSWDVGTEAALANFLGANHTHQEKLAQMKDEDLLQLIRTLVKEYVRTKNQKDELDRAEIQLNEEVSGQRAQDVFKAEKYFSGSDDGKQLRKLQDEVRIALRKVLNAHPDLKKQLQATLAAEQSAVSEELRESRRRADEVLAKVREKP